MAKRPRKPKSTPPVKSARPKAITPPPEPALAKARRLKEERDRANAQTLLASPAFMESVRRGDAWTAAEAAARDASKPFRDARDAFLREHQTAFKADSQASRDFDALESAILEAEKRTLTEHGFPPAQPPSDPEQLAAALEQYADGETMKTWAQMGTGTRPEDFWESESEKLWQCAASMVVRQPHLPSLPSRSAQGSERMRQLRTWCEMCEVSQAYGAAREFVQDLGALAFAARNAASLVAGAGTWIKHGGTYAASFLAWFDLSILLTATVRDRARSVYPLGEEAITLGGSRKRPTVIEAINDLGVYFRNLIYAGRRCPLDPDFEPLIAQAKAIATRLEVEAGRPPSPFGWGTYMDDLKKGETRAAVRKRLGVKSVGDALVLMTNEWSTQDPRTGSGVFVLMRFPTIDFDDLEIKLDREARAVLGLSRPMTPEDSGSRSAMQIGHHVSPAIEPVTVGAPDFSILKFLKKRPGLRFKITEITPSGGPSGRKTIGLRVTALSKRTPPLVTIDSDGVAITAAGIAIVDGIDPPTPHR